MPPPPPFFDMSFVFNEFLFSIVVVYFCLMIFFKTREVYQLTKHKGIKYFRDAFLFFGLAYGVRFFLSLVMFSEFTFNIRGSAIMPMPFFILLMGYFSTMAILCLIFSSLWKVFDNKIFLVIGHSIAIFLSLLSVFAGSSMLLLYLQIALLVVVVLLRIFARKDRKVFSQAKMLYFLVAALWLVNLFLIGPRMPMPQSVELLIRIGALVVFAVVYFKVSKWLK